MSSGIFDNRPALAPLLGVSALAVPPAILFAYLLANPELDLQLVAPVGHFYVVSAIAFLAALLSALLGLTAARLRDARALFMSLGFLLLSGFFVVHALTTPGVLVGANPWVGLSSQLALWAAAACVALSSVSLGKRMRDRFSRLAPFLVVGSIVGLVSYGAIALGLGGVAGSDGVCLCAKRLWL